MRKILRNYLHKTKTAIKERSKLSEKFKLKNFRRRKFFPKALAAYLGLGALIIYFVAFSEAKNNFQGSGMILSAASGIKPNSLLVSPEEAADIKTADMDFGSSSAYSGLPVGKIEEHKAQNGWGTVILLPQTHIAPGTQPADAQNNDAEVAQNQILTILSELTSKDNVKFVMAEGDLYGPVSQDKLNALSQKIDLKNKLASQIDELKNSSDSQDQSSVNTLVAQGNQVVSQLDREITLTGAAYELKAEDSGNKVILYGAEDKDTLAKCTDIIRNYLYEQDRLAQLQNGSGSAGPNTGSTSASSVLSLLMRQGTQSPGPAFNSAVSTILAKSKQENEPKLTEALSQIQTTYASIANLENSAAQAAAAAAGKAPSRTDNPYANVTSVSQIKSMMTDTEKQIQTYVLDERNKETAVNFAKALKDNDQKVGILQFGSGHADGMTKELNKQGLSVVIVTPNEVLAHDQDQNAQGAPVSTPGSPAQSPAAPNMGGANTSNILRALLGGKTGTIPGTSGAALPGMPAGSVNSGDMLRALLGGRPGTQPGSVPTNAGPNRTMPQYPMSSQTQSAMLQKLLRQRRG